jgi:hypothetical protein
LAVLLIFIDYGQCKPQAKAVILVADHDRVDFAQLVVKNNVFVIQTSDHARCRVGDFERLVLHIGLEKELAVLENHIELLPSGLTWQLDVLVA